MQGEAPQALVSRGLAVCLSGPNATPSPTPPTTAADCLSAFDFDVDGDVDLLDFETFSQLVGGT